MFLFFINFNYVSIFSVAPMTPDPDNITIIRTARDIYLKFNKSLEALRCAMDLNDLDSIRSIFLGCDDL